MFGKFVSFVAIIACYSTAAMGQRVKITEATRQDWSGGIAGHHGTYYYFTIEFADTVVTPVPDTLWIDQETKLLFAIDGTHTQDGTTKLIRTKKGLKFQIRVNLAHDDYAHAGMPGNNDHPKGTQPHIHWKGIALLSYQYKGAQRFLEIPKIISTLPPANYP
jgi:hypothetical protein